MTSFEQRREWALRQGNPQWIWPEVTPAQWQLAMVDVACVTAAILDGCDARLMTVNADHAGLAGYISGMGPLLGWWIEQGHLTAERDVATLLTAHLAHNRTRQALLATRARDVRAALAAGGVPTVALKGMHTAWCHFPDPGTRPMSDIDLLIAPQDRIRAAEMLNEAGFVCESRQARESTWRAAGVAAEPSDPTIVRDDDPWTIDLHHSLDICVAPGMPCARLDLAAPMACAGEEGHLDGAPLLLHLAVHAGSGLHSLTLVRLVEIVLVIRGEQAAGRLIWADFIAVAQVCNGTAYAWPALVLANGLMPGTVPDAVLDVCAAGVPMRTRRVIGRLNPATAQRVARTSLSEHFMWTLGVSGWFRQLAADLWPGTVSPRQVWRIYRRRGWALRRGRLQA